ncbi:MAG TPA: cytochrome c biogenesis protein ResB [Terriglobales bacterium]|nr:cytochrome c biogenesis protein ResB [Terriglobales bacterium]
MAFSLSSVPKRIHKTFSNLRTGVVLLILVGIASALGTFILQRPATDPDKLTRAYSPATLLWLDRIGLTDVFHTWWFLTLLGLVSLSIVLVSIDRFPNAWRFYARPYRKTDSHFRSALQNKVELPISNVEDGLNAAERALKKSGWPVERIDDRIEPSLYSERHRFSVMAVYIVHASLLLIFAGGIIDGVFGYSGFMALQKGEVSNKIELRTGGTKQIPFSVKCNGAGQENYADGSPKRWWSNLAVVENGRDTQTKEIVVNDPLIRNGLRFYQASFGPTGKLDGLKVAVTPNAGGEAREITLPMNQAVALAPNATVTLAEYIPDFFIRDNQIFKKSDDPVNPAFRLQVKNASGDTKLWMFPAYNGAAQGDNVGYKIEYRDMQMGYFTGLEVSHEPGQWLVWAGCLLMGAGLFVAFYMVHMRAWVTATQDARGNLVLWVGGQANKNRDRFEQKFDELVDNIRTELEGAEVVPLSAKKHKAELTLAGVK